MKSPIIYRICCFLTLCAITIPGISRTVISKADGEPIRYASIGVINRNIGTVSDSLGRFTLTIPAEYINDSVRISSVGYVAQTFAVKDLKNIPDTIELSDDVIALHEIVVKPQTIEHKTAGRKSGSGFLYIEVENYKAAGQGLAIPLTVNKRAWLKELGFTVIVNDRTLSHMKFRMNVYSGDKGVYTQDPAIRPVYFDYNKTDLADGKFRYVFPEEIMLEQGKYYIELEFLENFSPESFIMKSNPLTGKTRYRYASQSDWETLPFGAPLYIEYDNLK